MGARRWQSVNSPVIHTATTYSAARMPWAYPTSLTAQIPHTTRICSAARTWPTRTKRTSSAGQTPQAGTCSAARTWTRRTCSGDAAGTNAITRWRSLVGVATLASATAAAAAFGRRRRVLGLAARDAGACRPVLLLRQRASARHAASHPPLQVGVGCTAGRSDGHPATHGPAAHDRLCRPRFGLCNVKLPLVHAHQQAALAPNHDRHVSVQEHGKTAEHPLLCHTAPRDQLSDPVGEFLVVRHPAIVRPGSDTALVHGSIAADDCAVRPIRDVPKTVIRTRCARP